MHKGNIGTNLCRQGEDMNDLQYQKLNCYVTRKHGLFFAACITVNLTATGYTLEEARNNLDELLIDYLKIIVEGHEFNEFKHLLNRPAPFFMYIDYAKCFVLFNLFKFKKELTFEESAQKLGYSF